MSDEEHRPLSEHGPLSPGFEMRYETLRGEKGEQGERGERGETGNDATRLPVSQGRAVVYMFILPILLSLVCLVGLVYYGHRLSGQQQQVTRQQQAVVRQQREFLVGQQAASKKTCDTIGQIVAIPVAPGTWGARFEVIERNRLRELGCRP
jgi:hypothetical protein